jgi:hypothetical protein
MPTFEISIAVDVVHAAQYAVNTLALLVVGCFMVWDLTHRRNLMERRQWSESKPA